jgi:hypothetical protein
MSHFPILDAPYLDANADLCRTVLETLGAVEPHVDETDTCFTIPLRLVHDAANGIHLELGPYACSENDIERLRAAIRAYDVARTGSKIRRIQ